MTPIDNSGFQAICGNCDCPGFTAAVNWSYNAGTKVMTVTDASTLPSGDSMGAVNVQISDGQGHVKAGRIATAGGNVAITLTGGGFILGPAGVNIHATVVTGHRCASNLSAYNLGVAANGTGALGYVLNEGDVDGDLS